jgi:hypothetical protein
MIKKVRGESDSHLNVLFQGNIFSYRFLEQIEFLLENLKNSALKNWV